MNNESYTDDLKDATMTNTTDTRIAFEIPAGRTAEMLNPRGAVFLSTTAGEKSAILALPPGWSIRFV